MVGCYNLSKWFFINEFEGHEITGKNTPEEITAELLARYPHCSVVLTLGKQGVYFKNAECTAKHGAYTVKAVDTTGAGDTFTGYFLAGVEKGWGIHDILKRASIASAIAVSRAGAAASIPTLKEVLASKFIPE